MSTYNVSAEHAASVLLDASADRTDDRRGSVRLSAVRRSERHGSGGHDEMLLVPLSVLAERLELVAGVKCSCTLRGTAVAVGVTTTTVIIATADVNSSGIAVGPRVRHNMSCLLRIMIPPTLALTPKRKSHGGMPVRRCNTEQRRCDKRKPLKRQPTTCGP